MHTTIKHLLVYSITDGLGDYLIIGDLIRKIECNQNDVQCVVIHRNNPHVTLWPNEDYKLRFFNIYSIHQTYLLTKLLRTVHLAGGKIFALQMAPGSIQCFIFYSLLKHLKMVDYIVDFNLINADIITPPIRDEYILNVHLDQVCQLFRLENFNTMAKFNLPMQYISTNTSTKLHSKQILVGIHPWTRRISPYLIWPNQKWITTIEHLLSIGATPLLLGRDKHFKQFKKEIHEAFGEEKIIFSPSANVNELVQTIQSCSLLISLNSSVIHIAYACNVPTIVLSGPHLPLWTPRWKGCLELRDQDTKYPPSDERKNNETTPMVSKISIIEVTNAINKLLAKRGNF